MAGLYINGYVKVRCVSLPLMLKRTFHPLKRVKIPSHREAPGHPDFQDHRQHRPAGGSHLAPGSGPGRARGRLFRPADLRHHQHQRDLCHMRPLSAHRGAASKDPLHDVLPHILPDPPAGHIGVLHLHRSKPLPQCLQFTGGRNRQQTTSQWIKHVFGFDLISNRSKT